MSDVIEVEGLVKTYPKGVRALDGLDFNVEAVGGAAQLAELDAHVVDQSVLALSHACLLSPHPRWSARSRSFAPRRCHPDAVVRSTRSLY